MKRHCAMLPTLRVMASMAWLVAAGTSVANHFILPCDAQCVGGAWLFAHSMQVERELHTATLLRNGKVLVAGGRGGDFYSRDSAELYDWVTGTWTSTGRMTLPRSAHIAIPLADGRVLVAGGVTHHDDASTDWGVTTTAEIYDPSTSMWTATGSMSTPRFWFDGAALRDGRVLVAGGAASQDIVASAEIYDPQTGRWLPTGNLNVARYGHTLTTLGDGTVLAVRGTDSGDLETALASTELYDPVTGAWQRLGDSGAGTVFHTATLLPSGKVLVAGGNGGGIGGDAVYTLTMLYDPSARTWTRGGDLPAPVYGHAATVLPNGEVLVAGGAFQLDAYPHLRYEFAAVSALFGQDGVNWRRSGAIQMARANATMTPLPDGSVLLVGGSIVDQKYRTTVLPFAERFAPNEGQRWRSAARP